MKRLVVELTDRCNLRCSHCFEGRHGGRGELAIEVYDSVLAAAPALGIGEFSFTGGEPTLHRCFPEILERTFSAGYPFGLVTNGWTFAQAHRQLLPYRERLNAITFSLDGAAEATHDRQRGRGSYVRVIEAAALCIRLELPFTFNFVVSAHNAEEMPAAVALAQRLGAAGIRVIPYLQPAGAAASMHAAPMAQRLQAGMRLIALREQYRDFKIGIAPGFFSADLASCGSLRGTELNLAWNGKLDLCCHLSGHTRSLPGQAAESASGYVSAAALVDRQRKLFVDDKRRRAARNGLQTADYFACDYCVRNWILKVPAVAQALSEHLT